MLPLWFLIIVFIVLVLIFILLITNSVILHREWKSMSPVTTLSSERSQIYNLYIWNVVGSVVLGVLLLVCIVMLIFFGDDEPSEKSNGKPQAAPITPVTTKTQSQPNKGVYKITRFLCPECPPTTTGITSSVSESLVPSVPSVPSQSSQLLSSRTNGNISRIVASGPTV